MNEHDETIESVLRTALHDAADRVDVGPTGLMNDLGGPAWMYDESHPASRSRARLRAVGVGAALTLVVVLIAALVAINPDSSVKVRAGSAASSAPTGDGTPTGPNVAPLTRIADPNTTPLPPPTAALPAAPPLTDAPATGTAPVDESAARSAIEQAYHATYGGGGGVTYIEDGESLADIVAQAKAANPDAVGKVSAAIRDITFLSDHEASVRFDLLLNGAPVTADYPGTAVLVNGEWLVARSTYCGILANGGTHCP